MTKSQIKAELRRSACEDKNPYAKISRIPFETIVFFSDWPNFCIRYENDDDMRTFFLLVAEAL